MSFTVSGLQDMGKIVGKLKTIELPLQRAARRAGLLWVKQIQDGMRAAGSPSSPGDYPGVRSGTLVSSVRYQVIGADELRVGTGVSYARYLEDGTSRMEARPIIGNRIEINGLLNQIKNIIITEINTHIGR